MLNLMLAAAFDWSNPSFYILIGLIIVLIVMMIFRFKQSKKAQAEQINLLDNLKVGDRVTTHIGIYGKIVKIVETTNGKVFTIETGDKNKSELDLDYRYIASLDEKEMVTYDANGNRIENNKPLETESNAELNTTSELEETSVALEQTENETETKKKTKQKSNKKDDEIK